MVLDDAFIIAARVMFGLQPLGCAPRYVRQPPDCRTGHNQRQFIEDRQRPTSNIRLSCLSKQSEGRFDFLIARGFLGKPLVDRRQLVGCRLVFGAGDFRLDFER